MKDQDAALRWLTVAPKEQREVEFLLASWFPDLFDPRGNAGGRHKD